MGAVGVLVLLTAGCGRVGFEPLARGGDAPSDTAVDSPLPPVDLAIVLTADNTYELYEGTATAVRTQLGRAANVFGEDIADCPVGTGPERWNLLRSAAPDATYIYVAAWDDFNGQRGLIGNVGPLAGVGSIIRTGSPGWEVCADGNNPGKQGTIGRIAASATLADCNAGTSASQGWVNASGAVTPGALGRLVVGAVATGGGPFGPVCTDPDAITVESRWIWYHPNPPSQPFDVTGSNDALEYLLFRHPI